LVIGRTISHYRIIEELGAGGMGQVYLAEDVRLGRKLAVKVLSPKLVADEERVRRFGQEARAASALNHPNILTIHDIGQAGDIHFIATEFVNGETLRARLERGRLELVDILEIAIQTGSALAAAHDAGIVHRDVKPENVMVRPDGYVKVLDFGLAKLTVSGFASAITDGLTRSIMETNPGVVVGTFSYMSPEQARGGAIDARGDIFSLGVVLYEMIAGRLPFVGATPADVLGAILYVEPIPISLVSPLPETLARVVGRAISKPPEARYQTMGDLVADLRAVRAQIERGSMGAAGSLPSDSVSGHLASDVSSASQTGETQPTKPSDIATRSGAAPVRRRTAKRRIDSLAVLPLENASQDPEMEYLSDGITETMINTLSQLPKLRVMARSTVFRYKGRTQEPQAIGQDLSVRAVLTGRVLHRGDMLVIGAELVDVEDGSQIWGGQFTRRLSGIFELQEEISNEMADRLRLSLTGDQKKRLAKPATREVEAYQAYLKGRYLLNQRTAESFAKAVEHFDRAIKSDARYAAAYAGLGETYALSAALNFGLLSSRPEEIRRARAAAAMALELEETLADGHALLAFIRFRFDWDWTGAEREFKRALELNPGHAPSRHAYAMFLASRGRLDEALLEMRNAQQLDPLSSIVASGIGRMHHFARRFDEAIAQYRHVMQTDPAFTRVAFDLGLTLLAKGAYDEAFEELKKGGNQPFGLMLTSIGHALAGHRERASAAIGQLEEYARAGRTGHDELAMIYAAIGESKRASELLARACDERAAALAYAGVEPLMQFLRSDAECRAVLERAGLIAPAAPTP
jgi:eukaryotic-like serine/threonine-protein kinase